MIVTKNIANRAISPKINPWFSLIIVAVLEQYSGIPAIIPTKINKEAPFPTPFSVINSANHITIIAPAVKETALPIKNIIGSTPGKITFGILYNAREKIIDYMKLHYCGSNMVISIAGNYDEAAVLEDLKRYFADIPRFGYGSNFNTDANTIPQFKRCLCERKKDVEQLYIPG